MNAENFFDAMGQIDSKYIEEAVHYKAGKKKGWMRWCAAAACLCLVAVSYTHLDVYKRQILFWVLPDSDFSAQENRVLATAPEVSVENFFSGKLTEEVSEYMADQFPFRDFFVGMKAFSETVQLKGQNNGVIFGRDGYLTARADYPNEEYLKTNLDAAAAFQQAAEEQGIQLSLIHIFR